ncbi:cysteine hydrolase family protein [Mycobacterium paraintracellulare]|uniref:cysteine hydrolase family protein n=1 Tax=Mycobacterium paraintracellulare TaxID=1138383 RepID=UPI001928F706|nr:isochorismatase family cysteine hydrolase [Mycobacterium paraintracellulare]BCP14256.1 hypothetical protein MINTM021_11650 [Mycobacterium paraintracellulare]
MTSSSTAIPSQLLPADMYSRWFNTPRFVPDEPWVGLDLAATAVVLVDMINWQAHPVGASILALRDAGADEQADYLQARCETLVIPRLKSVLDTARRSEVAIVHARLASRSPDYTDVVPAFQPYMRGAGAAVGQPSVEPLDGLWAPGDISVVKHGSSAFASDLHAVLRNRSVHTVLYAGVVTSACVLLSTAAGFDLGYRQYLLSDCTAAFSDEDQDDAERLIGRYLARVVCAAAAIEAMDSASAIATDRSLE